MSTLFQSTPHDRSWGDRPPLAHCPKARLFQSTPHDRSWGDWLATLMTVPRLSFNPLPMIAHGETGRKGLAEALGLVSIHSP